MWTNAMDILDTHKHDASVDVHGEEDPFELPPLNHFPFGDEPPRGSEGFEPFPSFPMEDSHEQDDFEDDGSVHSDEFVDAEAFMADRKPGDDSFLREATGDDSTGVWDQSEDTIMKANEGFDRRASDIFVPKSRNMENVAFSSPKRSHRKSSHQTPVKQPKARASLSYGISHAAFSASNTAVSSEFEIHVDNRLVLTPNSFKYLQSQQRDRISNGEFALSHSKASSIESIRESHSIHAKQVVDAQASALSVAPDATVARPSSAEKAMRAGPAVIKKALHEIEAMLQPLDSDSSDSDTEPALDKLKVRLQHFPPPLSDHLDDTIAEDIAADHASAPQSQYTKTGQEFRQEAPPQFISEGVQADFVPGLEAGVQTDSYSEPSRQFASVETNEDTTHTAPEEDEEESRQSEQCERERPSDHATPTHQRPTKTSQPQRPQVSTQYSQTSGHDASLSRGGGTYQVSSKHNQTEVAAGIAPREEKPARPVEPRRGTSFRTAALRQSLEAASRKQTVPESENADLNAATPTYSRVKRDADVVKKPTAATQEDQRHVTTSKADVDRRLPLTAALPTQMARRCRRFLCSVGERMSEQIVFSNGSNSVGRICVSLLPLSTGCQQFSVSPAVLELQPRSRSVFLVTFAATVPGVVAGIFQFRAVGIDSLYEPYEVLIEASVRGDLQRSPPPAPAPIAAAPAKLSKPPRAPARVIENSPKPSRVTEVPAHTSGSVEITPTFLRFTATSRDTGDGDPTVSRLFVRVSNTTETTQKLRVKCAHEHLQFSPSKANVVAGSTLEIEIQPLCRPFGRDGVTEDWCGSMTVAVGDALQREVSVVIDRRALALLPTFDAIARVRQAISTQTDSFYFTKKVNRRGLYFHARAVECGSCVVGESHQVPVYICNGSDTPMTVFLQSLQDPFACSYQPTTLQARKFIEVPIVFHPKAVGKVATCLVAYTVSGKAAVTLIARGVDKPVANAIAQA